MVLTLYGNPQSTCTKRVATVLKETNTPFKFVVVDFMKGEHKAPEFLAKQPFGQVPYLVRLLHASPVDWSLTCIVGRRRLHRV
jgi:glutathione S-transferase